MSSSSSYPVIHCTVNGHNYVKSIVVVGNKHMYDFAGEIRECTSCHKLQFRYKGILWLDAPKQERQQERKPKPIDPNQLSLFD